MRGIYEDMRKTNRCNCLLHLKYFLIIYHYTLWEEYMKTWEKQAYRFWKITAHFYRIIQVVITPEDRAESLQLWNKGDRKINSNVSQLQNTCIFISMIISFSKPIYCFLNMNLTVWLTDSLCDGGSVHSRVCRKFLGWYSYIKEWCDSACVCVCVLMHVWNKLESRIVWGLINRHILTFEKPLCDATERSFT